MIVPLIVPSRMHPLAMVIVPVTVLPSTAKTRGKWAWKPATSSLMEVAAQVPAMELPPDDPLATPVVGADAADDIGNELVPPGIDGPAAGECFALW